MSSDLITQSRLAMLPFALLEWTALLVFLYCMKRFPRGSWQTVTSLTVVLLGVATAVIGQPIYYRSFVMTRFLADPVIFVIVVVEHGAGLALLYWRAYIARGRNARS
jgi:hypothetical protein